MARRVTDLKIAETIAAAAHIYTDRSCFITPAGAVREACIEEGVEWLEPVIRVFCLNAWLEAQAWSADIRRAATEAATKEA
jgi:hypothetical protein